MYRSSASRLSSATLEHVPLRRERAASSAHGHNFANGFVSQNGWRCFLTLA